ncbi:MAG: transposase [Planctomycetaceae bacterium]|nr:transposase [Planctomycetaceae bacterium]
MNEFLVDVFVRTRKPQPASIIIDLDPTDDPTHGKQQLSLFHGYSKEHSSFPMRIFEGNTGMPLGAWLRPGEPFHNSGKGTDINEKHARILDISHCELIGVQKTQPRRLSGELILRQRGLRCTFHECQCLRMLVGGDEQRLIGRQGDCRLDSSVLSDATACPCHPLRLCFEPEAKYETWPACRTRCCRQSRFRCAAHRPVLPPAAAASGRRIRGRPDSHTSQPPHDIPTPHRPDRKQQHSDTPHADDHRQPGLKRTGDDNRPRFLHWLTNLLVCRTLKQRWCRNIVGSAAAQSTRCFIHERDLAIARRLAQLHSGIARDWQ